MRLPAKTAALSLAALVSLAVRPLHAQVPSGLTLTIDASQREVFVGEPLKLNVTLMATRHVYGIPEGEELPSGLARFLVDDGTRTRTYIDYSRPIPEQVLAMRMLGPYEEQVMSAVLLYGGYADASPVPRQGWPPINFSFSPTPGSERTSFLFPLPGRYSIRVEYRGRGAPTLSNRLRFTVKEPTGDDREVLFAVWNEPRILDAGGDAAAQAKARDLVESFPRSRYLRWARLRLLEEKRMTPESEWAPLLSEDWGPFEKEALCLAEYFALGARHREKEAQARARLKRLRARCAR